MPETTIQETPAIANTNTVTLTPENAAALRKLADIFGDNPTNLLNRFLLNELETVDTDPNLAECVFGIMAFDTPQEKGAVTRRLFKAYPEIRKLTKTA